MIQPAYRRKAGFVAALVLLFSAGQWIGCPPASAEPSQAADTVTNIRYLTSRGNVTSYEIASALGWLKEKRLKLDSVGFTQGGPESLVALAGGSVDLAGAATPAIINAVVSGAKILGVMPGDGVSANAHSKFFVLADSPVHTPQDIRDKSIAVNTLGAHLDYVVREYLHRNSLPEDAVNLIAAPGPQLEQILRHKQADIVAVGEWQAVFAGKIEETGGVRVLFTDHDVLGDIVIGAVAMKLTFIDAHPQAVRDFVTVSAKAADWTREHPDDAKKLVADILKERGENPDLARYWPGFGVRAHSLYTDHDAQFWIDALERSGKLKPGQFAPEQIETNRFNDLAHLAQQ
ncbi:MAG TPA: ABC transporter substrate-binding protein [Stellaceae bacterium]|jgi:ABC-type nitrate/sulfonate/bicarbonate transport system substrate-binding protein|nr:ABC transporter substrate-binding protein [Stellaceae bacterium]